MANWDDTPPTKQELKATSEAWDATPPTDEELGKAPVVPESNIGRLEALLRGTAQGGSLGFADEITGALNHPVGAAKETANKFVGGPGYQDEDVTAYKKERDESRANYELADKEHPYYYGAGQLAGGITSGLATGGAASGLVAGGKLGLAGLAGLGAVEGAATGVGATNSDSTQDLALSGAAGGVIGGALPGVAKVVGPAAIGGAIGGLYGARHIKEGDSPSEKALKIGGGVAGGIGLSKGVGFLGNKFAGLDERQVANDTQDAYKLANEDAISLNNNSQRQGIRDDLVNAENKVSGFINKGTTEAEQEVNQAKDVARQSLDEHNNKITSDIEDAKDTVRQVKQSLQNEISDQSSKIQQAKKEIEDVKKQALDSLNEGIKVEGVRTQQLAAKNLEAVAGKTARFIDTERKKAGDILNRSYQALDDANISLDSTTPLTKLRQNVQNSSLDIDAKNSAEMLLTNLENNYQGSLSPREYRDLIKTVGEEAWNRTGDPTLKRLFAQAHKDLNEEAAAYLKGNGMGEISNQIAGANKNYSTIFGIESKIGRARQEELEFGTEKLRRMVKGLVKIDPSKNPEGRVLLDKIKNLNPKEAEVLITELEAASNAWNAPKSKLTPAEIQDLINHRLREIVEQRPELIPQLRLAGQVPQKATPELIESRFQNEFQQNPELQQILARSQRQVPAITEEQVSSMIPQSVRDRQQIFTDLNNVAGEQTPLPSLGVDKVQPSSEVINAGEALGGGVNTRNQSNLQNLTDLLKKADPIEGEQLAQQLQNNSRRNDLVNKTQISLENPGNLLKLPAKVAVRGASALGGLNRKYGNVVKSANTISTDLAGFLGKMAPQGLKELASDVSQTLANSPNGQKFSQILNSAAETSDPVKRSASMFILQQNPEFRQLFMDGKGNESK